MRKIIFVFVLLGIFLISLSCLSAFQSNSSNYKVDSIISAGANNLSSDNYKSEVISGVITGNISSSSYKQSVGFISIIAEQEVPSNVTAPITGAIITGGGGATITTPSFILNKDLIKVLIKQGESYREIIEIKNTGTAVLNISLSPDESIRKFMVISEEKFSLNQGESKSVFIDIFSKEEETPNIHAGKIIVKDEKTGETKIINVIIEIKEKKPLFDMIVDLLSKEVNPRSNVKAKIKITNLGDLEHIDVSIYSAIKNFNGDILSFKEENIAIDKELEITRSLRVPQGASPGIYIFYSKVSYGNITASSTDTFEVVEGKLIEPYFFIISGGVITLLIILLIILISRKKNPVYEKEMKKMLREIKRKEYSMKLEKKREYARKKKIEIKRGKKYLRKLKKEYEKKVRAQNKIAKKHLSKSFKRRKKTKSKVKAIKSGLSDKQRIRKYKIEEKQRKKMLKQIRNHK